MASVAKKRSDEFFCSVNFIFSNAFWDARPWNSDTHI